MANERSSGKWSLKTTVDKERVIIREIKSV